MKLLFTYIILALFSSSAVAQTYELEQVGVIPFEKTIKRAGKVSFKRSISLSFKSPGYLKKLSVDEGDYFVANQLLATLNTEELIGEKNRLYIQLLQAKKEVNRVKQLIAENLSSHQALDVAQTHLDTVREAYQVAYYNLDKAEIHAPFEGVVLTRSTDLAEFQSPGKEVLEVAAVDKNLIVKVRLTDTEIAFVKQGQVVQVQLPNIGMVKGVVTKVPVKNSIEGHFFLIEVLLEEVKAGQGVFAGQLAQVVFSISTEHLVYAVPLNALVEVDKNGLAILVTKKAEDKFERQAFEVLNIESQFIYLRASNQDETLSVVTQGWQQLDVSEH